MGVHVRGNNLADAWVNAYEALSDAKSCEAVNFTVTVDNPGREVLRVRRAIDTQVARLKASGKEREFNKSIHTVANTIFPVSLYRAGRPEAFFENAVRGQSGRDGYVTSWGSNGGTYIGRLLRYPTYGGETFNQVKRMLDNLDAQQKYQDSYEISLLREAPDPDPESPSLFTSASTFVPNYDNNYRGGQCLSHISLHLSPRDNVLSMTALYRHQTYLSRGYGNFLGLSRLLHFLVRESRRSLRVGELMVVASHAEIERSARASRDELLTSCRSHLSDEPVDIEWQARPFGSSWSDLKLPVVSA